MSMDPTPARPVLMNLSQLAEALGVSRAYLTRLRHRGFRLTCGKATKEMVLDFIRDHPDPEDAPPPAAEASPPPRSEKVPQ